MASGSSLSLATLLALGLLRVLLAVLWRLLLRMLLSVLWCTLLGVLWMLLRLSLGVLLTTLRWWRPLLVPSGLVGALTALPRPSLVGLAGLSGSFRRPRPGGCLPQ